MNLLETLVAFVSTALVARPAPESEAREALADSSRLLLETHAALVAARAQRDNARAEMVALVTEVAALRRERDMYASLVPPPRQWGPSPYEGLAAQYQQQNNAAQAQQNSLGLLNNLSNRLDGSEWRPCTCVPGRYDALRGASGA